MENNDSVDPVQTRDVCIGLIKEGDTLLYKKDLEAALTVYQKAHEKFLHLYAANQTNVLYNHDLFVSYSKLGIVFEAQGKLQDAYKIYIEALEVILRLVAADQTNLNWLSDLNSCHTSIAQVLKAQNDLAGARESYLKCVTIRKQLATMDPTNVKWRRSIYTIYGSLAVLEDAIGSNNAYDFWLETYKQMVSMKQDGLLDPSEEAGLEMVKNKVDQYRSNQY